MAGNFTLILLLLVLTSAAAKLLQNLTGILHGRMTAYMVPGIVCKMKEKVFESLQKLSIGFLYPPADRQPDAAGQRRRPAGHAVFIDGMPYFLFNVLTFLFSGILMFRMDWRLALVALFMLPPLFWVSYLLLPRYWHAHGRRSRTVRSLYSLLNDNLTGARVVRAFGQEENENRRFHKVNEKLREAEMKAVRYGSRFDIAYALARDIPHPAGVGRRGADHPGGAGDFTYGKLITFINYLVMMQGPMIFFLRRVPLVVEQHERRPAGVRDHRRGPRYRGKARRKAGRAPGRCPAGRRFIQLRAE